ncbi:hypothetical protein ACFWY9_03240 [Amycolatopsis sp. NPDC059027]|uniref:hypothetical protein n=1 Tax=Amycolatopsis sp. NPDC059027 TaxID=3346709 RepID=UPI00366E3CAB
MPAAVWTGRRGDPANVTADIARVLGSELGLAGPPSAMTLPADSIGVPAGSLLPPRERFSGMPAPTHCFVYVDAPAPRPFELRAAIMSGGSVIRRSMGLGTLLYAVPLDVPLPARVALGGSSFEGDVVTAGMLNADPTLLQAAAALTPTVAGPDPSHSWKVERLLALEPLTQGAVLLVRTLHRARSTGWTLSAGAVLDLAARIETVLR